MGSGSSRSLTKSIAVGEIEIEEIEASVVLIKNALSAELQEWLFDYVTQLGADPQLGFYRIDKETGHKVFNASPSRGRVFRELVNLKSYQRLQEVCLGLVAQAQTVCAELPSMEVTHMLCQYYRGTGGMGWHRDDDANDGDNDHPIVSISLGDSASFGIWPDGKDKRFITLAHGDVIVWGGRARMLLHNVEEVFAGSSPVSAIDGRINITFRSVPKILGREQEFQIPTY